MQHGLPALRHDWRIPLSQSLSGATFAGYLSGWSALGLGEPQPYPTFYFIGAALWIAHLALNPTWLIGLFIGFTIWLAANAAARIGRNLGAGAIAQSALAIFSALNPWVYSKYVAGHIYMIFAYAVIAALLAEITAERPRPLIVLWATALSITQLEFFIVLAPFLAAWAVMTRRHYAFFMLVLAAIPITIGIAAYRNGLLDTPFFLPWQIAESVPLLQGLALRGYTFQYAQSFQTVMLACYAFPVIGLAGAARAFRTTATAVPTCIGIASWIFASGMKGPLNPAYRWLVLHFTETGVFRELYDLIALLAIAYIVLVALATAKHRYLSICALLCAAALAVPWIVHPVSTFFVPAKQIPEARFVPNPADRVALLPPFQPLTFDGRGSGYDPDLFTRPGAAVPLNSFYPSFPVNEALALAEDGDLRYAAALSVTQIINRPYLRANENALKYQLAGVPRQTAARGRPATVIPLLVATGRPHVVSIGDSPLENSVFFGDAHNRTQIFSFRPDKSSIDPRAGWIDVRLTIPAHPRWGTSFGGVYTENPNAWLPILRGTSILARTTGQIRNERNQIVAVKTGSYHWWPLPTGTVRIRCAGTCAVLLSADLPPGLREHYALRQFTALPVKPILSWFYVATILPGTQGYLRFNERFDSHWVAIAGGQILHPQRIDTALTSWQIPTAVRGGTLYIVQTVALAQALAEMLAFLVLAGLTFAMPRLGMTSGVR